MPAIWWIRRDLRLHDNPALDAALTRGAVLPVFILDPFFEASPYASEKRIAFMLGGLRALDAALRERGSRLIVRRGSPPAELARLLAESGASAIFAQSDPSAYARRRDAAVAARLPLTLVDGLAAHPVEAVLKPDGRPYTVFTPYSRAWRALTPPRLVDLLPAPARLEAPPPVESLPIPPGFEVMGHRHMPLACWSGFIHKQR